MKLQVVVAGFVTGGGDAAEPGTEERGLDVKGIGVPFDENDGYDTSGVTGENYAGVTKTTIYIMYGGVTWYGSSGPDCQNLDEEVPPPEEMPNYSERSGFAGVAKAKDDTAKSEEVISEDGTESKTPDGYNDPEKVNRDLQYAPEDIVETDRTGENTADVTVRDTVIAPDPDAPVIS